MELKMITNQFSGDPLTFNNRCLDTLNKHVIREHRKQHGILFMQFFIDFNRLIMNLFKIILFILIEVKI